MVRRIASEVSQQLLRNLMRIKLHAKSAAYLLKMQVKLGKSVNFVFRRALLPLHGFLIYSIIGLKLSTCKADPFMMAHVCKLRMEGPLHPCLKGRAHTITCRFASLPVRMIN